MSSPLVDVADIECPNCSKLALIEGQQMATIATSDFLLLTKPHYFITGDGTAHAHIKIGDILVLVLRCSLPRVLILQGLCAYASLHISVWRTLKRRANWEPQRLTTCPAQRQLECAKLDATPAYCSVLRCV